jgi:hypothetical protein
MTQDRVIATQKSRDRYEVNQEELARGAVGSLTGWLMAVGAEVRRSERQAPAPRVPKQASATVLWRRLTRRTARGRQRRTVGKKSVSLSAQRTRWCGDSLSSSSHKRNRYAGWLAVTRATQEE